MFGDGTQIDDRGAKVVNVIEAGNGAFQRTLFTEGIGPEFIYGDLVEPLRHGASWARPEGEVLS